MKIENLIKLGKSSALISFLVGTLIFVAYYFTSNFLLLFFGYSFICIAGVINLIILISNIITMTINSNFKKKLLKTSGLLLLNIPVLFIYIWLASILMDSMRINFINTTGKTLSEIKILGCESINLSKLEPNESVKIWIPIKGDCQIKIQYLIEGSKKNEIVASYVTRGMGERLKHNIGEADQIKI